MSLHVAVIGAGIVGAATALDLVREGHSVTLLEPEAPGGRQAASYGNGGWISPASVVPMSMPGLWRKVPGYLTDPTGPLTIRWRALPRLAPWLLRFLRAGSSVAKVEATARALSLLLSDGPERHERLAAGVGCGDLIERSGLLYVYPDRDAFLAEALAWRLRKDCGTEWLEIDAEALARREPALSPRYRFGVLVENASQCLDPGAYVAAIAAAAAGNGAVLRRARARGFEIENGRLRAVRTDEGMIACDRAVISAGVWSKALAREAGDAVPLESERGYHAVIADPAAGPVTPIMPADGKMANTRMKAGLRIAGQVELASVEAEPDWRRVEILMSHALSTYPGLGPREGLRIERWVGHRPSTADGLPVIGRSKASPDVIHAFGHGHVGLAAGPATARAVADLVTGGTPSVDLTPFSPARF